MANITLNANNLRDVAKKMEAAANKIDDSLKEIDVIMSDMESVWSDVNSKKYLNKYEELRKDFPTFKSALYAYSSFLNMVVDIYQKEYVNPVSTTVN